MDIKILYNTNLDSDQKDKFIEFINIFREYVADKSNKFYAHHISENKTVIIHRSNPKLKFTMYKIDFEAIWGANLFHGGYIENIHEMEFVINQYSMDYYNLLTSEVIEPAKYIEKTYFDYLKLSYFKNKYPKSYFKWNEAYNLFISPDLASKYSSIGHFCRETIQEFSEEINESFSLDISIFKKNEDKKKIKNALNYKKKSIGESNYELIDSLITYWDKLSSVVQKLEHNSENTIRQINYEDVRRTLFLTAILMYEIDTVLNN